MSISGSASAAMRLGKYRVSTRARMLTWVTPSRNFVACHRLSVLGAITSVQQRLKLYSKVPPLGLVVYCGSIVTEEGKEKKVNIDFEPFKAINTSLYLCDNKFHTEVRGQHSLFANLIHRIAQCCYLVQVLAALLRLPPTKRVLG
jgi:hypothetical protein